MAALGPPALSRPCYTISEELSYISPESVVETNRTRIARAERMAKKWLAEQHPRMRLLVKATIGSAIGEKAVEKLTERIMEYSLEL